MDGITVNIEDVQGLPAELLSELRCSGKNFTLDNNVIEVIKELGGEACLDKILILYWRKYGVVFKRNVMTSRIFRLTKKGIVFSKPKTKGIFSLKPYSA